LVGCERAWSNRAESRGRASRLDDPAKCAGKCENASHIHTCKTPSHRLGRTAPNCADAPCDSTIRPALAVTIPSHPAQTPCGQAAPDPDCTAAAVSRLRCCCGVRGDSSRSFESQQQCNPSHHSAGPGCEGSLWRDCSAGNWGGGPGWGRWGTGLKATIEARRGPAGCLNCPGRRPGGGPAAESRPQRTPLRTAPPTLTRPSAGRRPESHRPGGRARHVPRPCLSLLIEVAWRRWEQLGGICCDPRRTAKRAGAEMAAAKGQGRAIFFVGIR
jgi:hypothetical protein